MKLLIAFAITFLPAALTCAQSPGKAAGTYERVIGMAAYRIDSTGSPLFTDSLHIRYNTDRGSIFEPAKFSSGGWGYPVDLVTVYDFRNDVPAPGGYLGVRFDTLRHYKMDTLAGAVQHQYRTVTRQGEDITHYDVLGYGQDHLVTRTEQHFSAAGFPDVIYSLYFVNSTNSWDTTSIRYLSYSPAGRLLQDSTYYVAPSPWGPGHQWTLKCGYSYYPDQRLKRQDLWAWLNGQWQASNGLSYFYDGVGALTTALAGYTQGTAGIVDSSYRRLYAYDAAGRCTLRATENRYGTGNWLREATMTLHYNTAGDADTVNDYYQSGSFSRRTVTAFAYNAFHHPEHAFSMTAVNSQPASGYDSIRYRYESYLSNAVPAAPESPAIADVFPNPNTGRFFIAWRQVPQHTSIVIELTSLAGQCVKKLAAVASYPLQQVNLEGVPPGAYLLRLWQAGRAAPATRVIIR